MASKKSRPLVDPPSASSSEEEETDEEEEEEQVVAKEEESSDESDDKVEVKEKTANLKTSQAKPTKKNPPVESSSESDSEKSPRASDFTIKPIVKPQAAKRRMENGKSPAKPKKLKTEAAGEKDAATATATTGKSKSKDLTKEKSEKIESDVSTKVKSENIENDDLKKLYPYLISACESDRISYSLEFLKNNLSLIGSSYLKEMDTKWKKHNAAEMELYLKRIDLLREDARMVITAMKSNKN